MPLLGSPPEESPKEETLPESAFPLPALSDSFILPVIACLPALAEGDDRLRKVFRETRIATL